MATVNYSSTICIIERDTFMANLPRGWENVSGKVANTDNQFTCLIKGKKFEGRSTCFELNTLGDLEDAKVSITRQPIFTTAKCFKHVSDDSPDSDITTLIHNFIVLINTEDPSMKSLINEAFARAEQYLRERKNFRITIPISPSVKQFYKMHRHYYVNEQVNDTITVQACDIYLTHGVKAPNCCDVCLQCESNSQKVFCISCFPFFLVLGLPYLCYKKCIRRVHEPTLERSFPVKLHKGPFPAGFDLKALLFTPSYH